MSTRPTETEWLEIRHYASRAEAEQHALVLVAVGVECRLAAEEGRIGLLVEASQAREALSHLAAYCRENEPRPEPPLRRLGEGFDGALAYGAVLLFIDAAAARNALSRDWLVAGHAQAGRILDGEWWRALTALGLHADLEHLLANLVAGSLFALFLSQIVGAGLAWLAILIAGGLGNLVNALLQPATHSAIGASTAVFGALGLLAGSTWRRQAQSWRQRLRQFTPLAAGAMLVAFIGVGGERTDVGAHIAGFAVGCALGAGLYLAGPHLPQGRMAQHAYAAAAVALFSVAWMIALNQPQAVAGPP
jgi:rhomboid protease GluP